MRVLNLNNTLPSRLYPHKVTYIAAIGECMRRAGCEVVDAGIRYERPATALRKAAAYARFWAWCAFSDLSRYDAVYVSHVPFCWPVLLNRSLRGRRLYIHWHGNDLVGRGASRWLRLLLCRRQLRRAVHVVPSQYFAGKFAGVYPPVAGQIVVSPSGGVDTGTFAPSGSTVAGRFVIGFPSELTSAKGADDFAALMERHREIEAALGREVEFAVIRYGAGADEYLRRFESTGARLQVYERMPRGKMPEFYAALSMAAVLSGNESLGLVALEAMSCGVPVLAREVCAFPEFVRSGQSGELVPSDVGTEALLARTIAIGRGSYEPRTVVTGEYSRDAVVAGYRRLFR